MFERTDTPRVYHLPVGCDFLVGFYEGLKTRLAGHDPWAVARIKIFVNTERTRRRLTELFVEDGAGFLPQILIVTDISDLAPLSLKLPPPVSALQRKLQLAQMTQKLLEQRPEFGAKHASFDLADSLAALLDDMQGEGVGFEVLAGLDVGSFSKHWQDAREFLNIIGRYWSGNSGGDAEDRRRQTALALRDYWADSPPQDPVLVVGSTGSRGATALFMKAVADLPQGAVILPGYDTDLSAENWQQIYADGEGLDHPQAGLAKLFTGLGVLPHSVSQWTDVPVAVPERNALVSLALRPAPMTDQWLDEGPKQAGDVPAAFATIDIIEAADAKTEALAIATRLRKAAEDKQRAVLISPDRQLTRRVSAGLKRWGIEPDDSAGQPLHLSPPGIFLRLAAAQMTRPVTPKSLLELLSHPLCNSTETARKMHGLRLKKLEVAQLRGHGPQVEFSALRSWAADQSEDTGMLSWVDWSDQVFQKAEVPFQQSVTDWVAAHLAFAESLAQGHDEGPHQLWQKAAGEEALKTMTALQKAAPAGGAVTQQEYLALLNSVLSAAEVREPTTPHALISIWGTLEARVQGADLVILGGLNEGVWPRLPEPDPWLNRQMRKDAGLLLPDRNIGLSAHDFQQAIAAPSVVLSRAKRGDDAPTVPSRWWIRLSNLVQGLGEQAKTAWEDSVKRGDIWCAFAGTLDRPETCVNSATRPAPCPPLAARPNKLSVTQIDRLVRNPYEIYARKILRLEPLKDLRPEADHLERGTALHLVLEKYCAQAEVMDTARFLEFAREILEAEVPWPAERQFWLGRLARFAEWFLPLEAEERATRDAVHLENWGEFTRDDLGFTITAKADRMDQSGKGVVITDYKTGAPPSAKQVWAFEKQLPLTAIIAENGGFGMGAMVTDKLRYISFKDDGTALSIPFNGPKGFEGKALLDHTYDGLQRLIGFYHDPSAPYIARDRVHLISFDGDYDHLSRYGEWSDSDPPVPEDVS